MQNAITQNPIRVNHVGFTSKGSKRFVLTDNQTGEDTFSIFQFSLMGEGDAAMCVLLNEDTEHLAFMLSAYGHANGGFLALCGAAELLGDKEFASVAQSQAEVILGANLYDASLVNGVGHNHLGHKPYGQFFPPVPYIPGAIHVALTDISHAECSEYDMPCVGMFMYLLAECIS